MMKILLQLLSKDKIFLVISILLLIPSLFFPMFCDIAIFMEAGKTINNGGKIYVDYIDIKQPGFYYFFALITNIFGYSEIGIRIFSFIWQSITLLLINYLINRQFKDKYLSSISVIVYSLSYVELGYGSSVSPETFLGLFILGIFVFYDNLSVYKSILIGLLIGISISFKYTFGILLPILFLMNYLFYRKTFLKSSVLMIIGTLIAVLICFLPLLDPIIYDGFMDVSNFLIFYSSIPPFNAEFVKDVLTSFSSILTYYYSMTFFIFLVIGIYIVSTDNEYQENKIINATLLITIFLFITIILEKKLTLFHLSRLLIPFSILTSIGIYQIIKALNLKKLGVSGKIILIILIPILLVFSPLPRYTQMLVNIKTYFSNISEFDKKYQIEGDNITIRESYINIAKYIRTLAQKDDFVKVISIGGNMINFFLNEYKGTALPQSCFYYGLYKINNWVKLHRKEIKKSDWIIVQNNDKHPKINGHNRTSYESLQLDTLSYKYIEENFIQDTIIPPFLIFKRK